MEGIKSDWYRLQAASSGGWRGRSARSVISRVGRGLGRGLWSVVDCVYRPNHSIFSSQMKISFVLRVLPAEQEARYPLA